MALRWIGLIGLAATAVLAACSNVEGDEFEAARSGASKAAFNKNSVLTDKEIRDVEAMSVDDVQKLFEETPWDRPSVLATYKEGGKTAAEIVHEAAAKHKINPLALIVRLQMEQGLLSKEKATDAAISIAFGCGCPHSAACNSKYEGFANQAECAAGTLDRSIGRAVTTQGTASGWARNKSKETVDGVSVKPTNAATAALYTYTPYVGTKGGGDKANVGGAYLHYQVWNQLADAVGYDANADKVVPPERDGGGADSSAPVEEEDASTPIEEDASTEPTPTPDASTPDASAPKGDKPSQDGSDDDEILNEGNAPPASNAPPPSSSSSSRRSKDKDNEDMTEATEEELATKKKSSGGCSTTGTNGSTNAALVVFAAAAAISAAKRRRERTGRGAR